jgi:phosphoglycolate phosphatase
MRYQTILFDLDGTLTDPKPGITNCIRHALQHMNVPVPDADELTWCIGPPLRASFKKLLATNDDALAERAITLYRERFAPIGLYENEVYEGISQLLAELRATGHTLLVATSKPHVYANEILRHFDLARHFTAVFGAELTGGDKKSELIGKAVAQVGFDVKRAVMIGDRDVDIFGARQHSIDAIGVAYGYGGIAELEDAQPHAIAATVDELRDLLHVL